MPSGVENRDRLAARIRVGVLSHLESLGIDPSSNEPPSKEAIRKAHEQQRIDVLISERTRLSENLTLLIENFAIGKDVKPDRIDPELVLVNSNDETGLIFRLACTLWSVPVSKGYGRRMRFLVRDKSNQKLIGIFALGDPVAGMSARDSWIKWDVGQRREKLNCVLDAYVCGAVPPYNMLLGGKLVVSLMGSKEVINLFDEKYRFAPNHWGKYRFPRLALITVTSALGRSSLYNRVKLEGLVELKHVGSSTKGWGHFQIPSYLFEEMRKLLEMDGHWYATGYKYGDRPNWKMRAIREALNKVELNPNLLLHGISREVFAMPLASNWQEFLLGSDKDCNLNRPSADEISKAAISRWMLPRSQRDSTFRGWTKRDRASLFDPLMYAGSEIAD